MKLTSHFLLDIGVEHGGQASGACRERGIRGNAPDTDEIHRRERAARIESVPAEPQQQAAGCRDGQIMRQHGPAAVALELAAEAGAENDGARQGDKAADGVHHRRSGEIMKAGPERRQELPALPIVARKPSGPQAQWPMIG